MIETRGASRIRPSGLAPSSSRADTPPEGWEVLSMATQRKRPASAKQVPTAPDAAWEHRMETIEARVEYLERQLEGLQDALYRQATLEDANIGELRKRIAPERLARDLEEDARKRGL